MELISLKAFEYKGVVMLLALFALIIASASVRADGPYEISWSTIDGGGGTSTGGDFTLSGTIGQPDAGMLSGGDYKLAGGFWSGQKYCFVNLPDLAKLVNI